MKKILLIEDSPTVRTMISAVLKRGGIDVKTAEKGSDGHTQVKEWKPDLVLLDLLLPDTNGLDLLAKLKSDESCKDIPVVMLTSQDSPDDVVKALKIGASDYLVKYNTMPKVLLEKVKKWIE